MREKEKRKFDIRAGDEWVRYTNDGGISRTITGIDDDDCKRRRVYYRSYGCPYETSCLLTTFRRWWKAASLEFATDWNNRAA